MNRSSLEPLSAYMTSKSDHYHEQTYTQLKKQWCDSFEKDYLINSLNRNHGNVTAAAHEAKIDRSNYLRLLRKHHIHANDFRPQDPTVIEDLDSNKAA